MILKTYPENGSFLGTIKIKFDQVHDIHCEFKSYKLKLLGKLVV